MGTTFEQIQAWISVQSWDAKPIRALSSTVWLCGTESKFDSIFLQWNDAPVLIRWVNQRKSKHPVILAGNLQQTTPKAGCENTGKGIAGGTYDRRSMEIMD